VTITSALPLQSLRGALVAGLALAWTALAFVAVAIERAQGLSPAYPMKCAGVFALVLLFVALSVRRHHPHPKFGAANAVTTFRAAVVALIAGTLGESPAGNLAAAAAVSGIGVMSLDGVDGWLARRSGLESDFGARFDMEIDSLLILALSVVVWQHGKAGSWIALAGLLRYIFVVAGWALPWMRAMLPPSVRRKVVCVVQIAGLAIALLPAVPVPASAWISAATLGLLSASFAADTVWLWRRAE